MIPFDEAQKIILGESSVLQTIEIDLTQATGHVLAQKIHADEDQPPFDRSAMDGYAYRRVDQERRLKVIETIVAGSEPQREVGDGECSKIMTGACIPVGANAVVRQEFVEASGDSICIVREDKTHIVGKGEFSIKGELILEPGHRIRAQEAAIFASFGLLKIRCFRSPRVGIIATGSEIVAPSATPQKFQIRNSNSTLLAALSEPISEVTDFGAATDQQAIVSKLVSEALEKSDVLLISGGISVGDYDFVRIALQQLKAEILVQGIAMQPAKPTTFAKSGRRYIFGLPGNPAAAFTAFHTLVRPFLETLSGIKKIQDPLILRAGEKIKRKDNQRTAFIPVKIETNSTVKRVVYRGSGDLMALSLANALIRVDPGTQPIKKGDSLIAYPI
jgi:molybdopterin molybdotransferase